MTLFLVFGPTGTALVSSNTRVAAMHIVREWLDWPTAHVIQANGMEPHFTHYDGSDTYPVIFSPDDGNTWERITAPRVWQEA